jgi:hypothetical protein
MTRWPVLILVLLVSALGLAACGDDSGGSGDSADAILQDTFSGDKDVKSGRLDVKLNIDAKGVAELTQPVAISLNGPFESTGGGSLPKFSLTADIDVNGQRLSGGAVSTGDAGFLLFQGQAYQLDKALYDQFKKGYADQAKCNEEEGGGVSLESLGVDPRRWLTNVEKVGTEEVGGAETTHLSGTVDVPRMLDDVNTVLGKADTQSDPCAEEGSQPTEKAPQQLSEAEKKKIAESVKSARVDLWSGDEDRILRRMNIAVDLVDGKQSGTVKFDLTIGAINEEQTIEAPKDAKPLSDLTGQLGGQIPGLGSGAATPGGSSGSGGTASQYTQCVQEAGQDVKKLQACAELIGR